MKPLPPEDLQAVVDAVNWEPLRGARILLTGGTGFMGRWLVESFVLANDQNRLGAKLWLTMARTQARESKDVRATIWDVVQSPMPYPYPGVITHCIHAACPSCANPPVDDLTMWRTVVNGTDNVLRWCHENEAKRILYISSGAAEHRPDTAYGAAKKAAETLCGIYAKQYGMEIPIARPYALIGPGLPLDAHFAIGNFIRDALAGGPVKVVIGHTILRSYLYASDVAIQLWRLLLKGPSCIPVDIGSRNVRSIRSVAHLVAGTLNVPVEATDVAGESPDSYVPKLGLSEDTKRVGLKEAILKTARWHGWGE